MTVGIACSAHTGTKKPGIDARPFGKADADAIAHALVSADASVRSEVLSDDIEAKSDAAASPLVPVDSALVIDPASFAVAPSGLPSVDATITGSSPGRWRLYLSDEANRWKVLGTERL